MTVDDVNALIPELNLIFQRLVEIRRDIAARANEIERLGYDPATVKPRSVPPEIAERVLRLEQQVVELERQLEKVGALGGILQDLELGLVDFLHVLDGREVFLCWQFGEPMVSHFHAIGDAFSGRARLPGAPDAALPH